MNGPKQQKLIWSLFTSAMLAVAGVGCQSTVGGQTMPSAYYLRDDVQFFPAGPELKLRNQIRALEQYKLDRQALDQGLAEEVP